MTLSQKRSGNGERIFNTYSNSRVLRSEGLVGEPKFQIEQSRIRFGLKVQKSTIEIRRNTKISIFRTGRRAFVISQKF